MVPIAAMGLTFGLPDIIRPLTKLLFPLIHRLLPVVTHDMSSAA
ncbi:hypothetical protein SUS17_380 [Sphingomonas sp. S17]|nr:hypothetical protein SUS17_380 [Sphingomonas sp. S17]